MATSLLFCGVLLFRNVLRTLGNASQGVIFATLFLAYCLVLGVGGYIGEQRGWWK